MSLKIEDGEGRGIQVGVTLDHHLKTLGPAFSLQLHGSAKDGSAYQMFSGIREVSSAGAYGILAIKNDSTKTMMVTYIRTGVNDTEVGEVQFDINVGGTWVAGTAISDVNVNLGSANQSGVLGHYNAIPTGSVTMDSCFLTGPSEMRWSKEGSLIVPPGKILSIKGTTETDTAKIYARVSYLMLDPNQITDM